MLSLKVFIYLLSIFLWCINVCYTHSDNALLLLISMDGFRWDYIDLAKKAGKQTPNFDSMKNSGVSGRVKNAFVSKTFPNHFSMVTGMYEESHGVVGNNFYDPVYNQTFFQSDTDSKWFNNGTENGGGEPIWIRNQEAPQTGFKRRSGVMFWVGSESKLRGQHPHHHRKYDESYPPEERVKTVIKWFATEDAPINLGLLYFSEPDATGHKHGPESVQLMDVIEKLDGQLGTLIEGFKQHKLHHKLNIIVTSDHGMTSTPNDKVLKVDEFVPRELYKQFGHSPVWNILPMPGKEELVYNSFKKIPHVSVYNKKNIPPEYHYKYNRRIMPILVVADEHYSLTFNNTAAPLGNHGYNNSLESMHQFFLAHGPAFKQNLTVTELINIVDIYPLMCQILDITPGPNDGSIERIHHILKEHEDHEHEEGIFTFNLTILTFLISVGFAATVSGIFCVAACRSKHKWRRYVHHHVALNNIQEGHTRLLTDQSDDEEEIP